MIVKTFLCTVYDLLTTFTSNESLYIVLQTFMNSGSVACRWIVWMALAYVTAMPCIYFQKRLVSWSIEIYILRVYTIKENLSYLRHSMFQSKRLMVQEVVV